LNPAAYTDQFLLSAFNFTKEPAEQQAQERKIFEKGGNAWADGALASYERWQKQPFQQLTYRQAWQAGLFRGNGRSPHAGCLFDCVSAYSRRRHEHPFGRYA
jgi:hypothetical protein